VEEQKMARAGSDPVSAEYGPRVLDYRILGPLEVAREGELVELGGPKQRATLAILLLNANRVVSVDRLADDLYAGAPPVTALKQVQRQISDLRRTLGTAAAVETRSPGYAIRLAPEQLDLARFERLTAEAAGADPAAAGELLRRALGLWRGQPLADLTYEPFAQAPIQRLEEIRLVALEERVDADLVLGRHSQLVPELEQLAGEHPLRERFAEQLMLALYRAGRHAEALDAYRRTRAVLVGDFGLEPSPALQRLERRILEQDPTLELVEAPAAPAAAAHERTLLAVPSDDEGLERLLALAAPLTRGEGRELIVARLVGHADELEDALRAVTTRRDELGFAMRVAAFTAAEPARDVERLAEAYDVELVLLDSPGAALLEHATADVAVALGRPAEWAAGGGIFAPFGGAGHDWAALELAGWLASSADVPLRLVGTEADPARGRRDASRLLANASLAIQRLVGIDASPLLVERSGDALLEAVADAALVVVGDSGSARRRLLGRTEIPLVVVRGGLRPGGLSPRDARTRFSWSLEG
jgi:DNA-binding SARP family transcriptional activator